MPRFLPCTAVLGALVAFAGVAPAADDRLESAEKCGRITADPDRLRCFDALFGQPRDTAIAPAPRPAAPATEPAAQPAAAQAPAKATEADFGLTEAQRKAGKPEPAKPAEAEEIRSRVTRVIPRGPEPPVLELENGQQWLLLESMGSSRFRAGDGIVVRRGTLGSYLASNPDRNGAWRVRRVR